MKFKLYLLSIISVLVFSASSSVFAFQVIFTPGISGGEEFTDNLFVTKDDPKTEYITTLSPSARLELLWELSGADIFYEPTYAYYNEYDEKNTWRHRVNYSGWAQITKNSRLDLRDNLIITDDPFSEDDIAIIRTEDPFLPVDATNRRNRNRYAKNYANVSFKHQFGISDSFRLGYSHKLLENEDPAIEDNASNEPSAGITYWFAPQWGMDVNASYTKSEYDTSDDIDRLHGTIKLLKKFTRNLDGFIGYSHTTVDYDGIREDNKTYNPSIGFSYLIEEDISLNVDVGFFINDSENRSNQSGMTGDIRLIKRFERGSINLSAIGGYDSARFDTIEQNGFEKFAEGAVSATYKFTRYMSGNINGAYRYSDYVDQGYQDDKFRGGLGVSLTPLKWLSLHLNYYYNLLESTDPARGHEENSVMIRFSIAPSTPYRLNE